MPFSVLVSGIKLMTFERGDTLRFFREKQIIQGSEFRDVEIVSYTTEQERRLPRIKKKAVSSLKQIKANDKNSQKHLRWLINSNFTEEDYRLDLTYENEPLSLEEAEKKLANFKRRLKSLYKKHGLELKYIAVTGGGSPKKRGEGLTRIHHHLIINGGISRDEIEACWSVGRGSKKRSIGRRSCQHLQLKENEQGFEALAVYFFQHSKEREKNEKRWSASTNLKQPIERRDDNAFTSLSVAELLKANENERAEVLSTITGTGIYAKIGRIAHERVAEVLG